MSHSYFTRHGNGGSKFEKHIFKNAEFHSPLLMQLVTETPS